MMKMGVGGRQKWILKVSYISSYFEGLFAAGSPCDFEDVATGIEPKVTVAMNANLMQESSGEEIKEALFQMHPNKASGVDGMHAIFFQKI